MRSPTFLLLAGMVVGMLLAASCSAQTFGGIRVRADAPYSRSLSVTTDDWTQEGGEPVSGYFTINRYGQGTSFALVAEVQDVWGGGFWGIEVDAMTTGPSPGNRHGIGIVIGRSGGRTEGIAEVDHGLWIAALPGGRAKYGIRIDAPTDTAISAPGGAISLSDDPAVPVIRFDAQTGYLGLFRGKLCVVCWHATTGEERHLWTP